MTNTSAGSTWIRAHNTIETLSSSLLQAVESRLKNATFQRICSQTGIVKLTAPIEQWIKAKVAGPDIAECVEMTTAINRALRHTHTPDRNNLAQRLALPAPRKIVDESLEDLNILVVHNSGTLGQLTRHTLTGFGINNNIEVPDMKTACEALRLNPFDLVITHDQDMAMSSLPLMQLVSAAQAGGSHDLPILLLSTRSEVSSFAELKESGVSAFLRAPFDGKSLYKTLKAIFSAPSGRDVLSMNYCGPCRRSADNKSTHFTDRRRFEAVTVH